MDLKRCVCQIVFLSTTKQKTKPLSRGGPELKADKRRKLYMSKIIAVKTSMRISRDTTETAAQAFRKRDENRFSGMG